MPRDVDPSALFDAAAEALILVDATDSESTSQLVHSLDRIVEAFGSTADEAHPARAAVRAAQAFADGDRAALADVERHYTAARALISTIDASGSSTTDSSTTPAPLAPPKAIVTNTVEAGSATQDPMPLAGDDDLLRDFAVRSAEHLDDADGRLLVLERHPDDLEAIDAVFRAFHTIKGMAGFLALDAVSNHAHSSENLLAAARTSGVAVTESEVQALFVAVDTMRDLVACAAGVSLGSVATTVKSDADPQSVRVGAALLPAAEEPTHATELRAGTVRVQEARLDALLDAIGEMVIAESMVSASTRTDADAAVLAMHVERLDKITRELQHMATSLRMVPLRATFRRLARLVRDLAHNAGKQVDFVTYGEDTELDKTVVDAIQDPLIHALRNAIDHGVETPAERVAAGKPETARVELRAYHQGGAIHVEVTDDGRGLNAERILAKGRALGLIGETEEPSEDALFNLVFSAGFSTAETITDVSGRGVGMDVVRRTVEQLRGRVRLESTLGVGTTLAARLPVTLAIIDGMICRVGDERYIIPVLAIERSVRPLAEDLSTVAQRGLMLSTDDGLIPVVRLHELLGVAGAEPDATKAVVVIIDEGGQRAGLLVCELLGQQQTVIKPLGDAIADQPGVTGAAIMPDGLVGLILDGAGLIRLAHGKE